MIILDTNVLSALMLQAPDQEVVRWLDQQARTSIWTSSVTVLEVHYGLQIMAIGKRRTLLVRAFEKILEQLDRRIAIFDGEAALYAADLMASRHKRGRPADLRDTMIAGIALSRHASVATRNTVHFDDAGVSLINPWNPGAKR